METCNDAALRDLTLKADLDDAKNLRKTARVWGERPQETEEVVCGCITEELEIVGRVLVVGGNEQCHHTVQECLTGRVVREQSVPEEGNHNQHWQRKSGCRARFKVTIGI